MVRKEYGILEREQFIQEAKVLEKRADEERRRGKAKAEDIGLMYLDAGDLRRKAGDVTNARNDYADAKTYGFPYNREVIEKIDEHIRSLSDNIAFSKFKESIKEKKNLGSKLHAVLSIAFFVSALFFVSLGLTGNVIGGLNYSDSRLIGSCFFLCGLIFTFVLFQGKNKKSKKKK